MGTLREIIKFNWITDGRIRYFHVLEFVQLKLLIKSDIIDWRTIDWTKDSWGFCIFDEFILKMDLILLYFSMKFLYYVYIYINVAFDRQILICRKVYNILKETSIQYWY